MNFLEFSRYIHRNQDFIHDKVDLTYPACTVLFTIIQIFKRDSEGIMSQNKLHKRFRTPLHLLFPLTPDLPILFNDVFGQCGAHGKYDLVTWCGVSGNTCEIEITSPEPMIDPLYAWLYSWN